MNESKGLVEFLRERLDEDKAMAQVAGKVYGPEWVTGQHSETVSGAEGGYVACGPYEGALTDDLRYFIARHDPAHVLADIAAKRRIIELHAARTKTQVFDIHALCCATCQPTDEQATNDWPCDTLLLLAEPYADHPDHRPEWSTKPRPQHRPYDGNTI